MAKNKKGMCIAVEPELQEEMKEYARKKGFPSVSSLICMVMLKAIKVPVADDIVVVGKSMNEDILPVMLKIPRRLQSDREALQNWMQNQTNIMVDKLCVAAKKSS